MDLKKNEVSQLLEGVGRGSQYQSCEIAQFFMFNLHFVLYPALLCISEID